MMTAPPRTAASQQLTLDDAPAAAGPGRPPMHAPMHAPHGPAPYLPPHQPSFQYQAAHHHPHHYEQHQQMAPSQQVPAVYAPVARDLPPVISVPIPDAHFLPSVGDSSNNTVTIEAIGHPLSYPQPQPAFGDKGKVARNGTSVVQMGTDYDDGTRRGRRRTRRLERRMNKKSLITRLIPQPEKDSKVYWSRMALVSMLIFSVLTLILEAALMQQETGMFLTLKNSLRSNNLNWTESSLEAEFNYTAYHDIKAGVLYHSAFLAAVLFGVFVNWDAILQQNIIQLVAAIGYSIGMFVFTIIQIGQTQKTYNVINSMKSTDEVMLGVHGTKTDTTVLTVIEYILLIDTLIWVLYITWLAWQLFKEFGWRIYRRIGGNIQLEKEFRDYHLFLLCNKYSLFFVTVFAAIIIVMPNPGTAPIHVLAIPGYGIPPLIITLFLAYYGVRKERVRSMVIVTIINLGLIVFIIYFLAYALNPDASNRNYEGVELPITFFGALSLVMLIGSILFSYKCARNFGGGLKFVLAQAKRNAPPTTPLDLDE
ncbi:hypothetical protein HK101_005684 [Irineochytrium annulatum]|nr:hypothetical protein HK101_005684 [Irineochytrium annulatum]